MLQKMFMYLIFAGLSFASQARDFENAYAVYGAGSQSCSVYLQVMQKGGAEQDVFIDWITGYLSAFNVIVPNTYNILGDMEFPTVQTWLQGHCQKYPNELLINAVARLTEILYPTRYQSGLQQSQAESKIPPAMPAE